MDTICAISTPYGIGGIAVIRLCGDNAIQIIDTLFRGKTKLQDAIHKTIHYGTIQQNNEILDEVLVSIFRAPHSFTGEDTVEISCHGSIFIQQEIIQWLIQAGARTAKPGEFTQRAFVNGKLDLTKAEAVADLIAAQSKAEKDLAIYQLRGNITSEINILREQLLHFTSLIELELDFADHEELEFADRTQLQTLANTIANRLTKLTQSFQTGNAIRNGIPVAIVGAPNAGKSTLLNALLGEERAIVSDIQGTTRDTIEDTLIINGIQFRLIDTAGIRQTNDQLEKLGIERSQHAIKNANIILHVIDPNQPQTQGNILPDMTNKTYVQVWNKADLYPQSLPSTKDTNTKESLELHHPNSTIPPLPNTHPTNRLSCIISAKNKDIAPLLDILQNTAYVYTHMQAVTISNARHYEALLRALQAIQRVQEGLINNLSGEWLSLDLQDCLTALGEITGQITSQEVLNNIFSHFCIGK